VSDEDKALTHELLELIKQVTPGELDFNDDITAKLDPLEAAVEKAFNNKTRVFQNMHQLAHFLQRIGELWGFSVRIEASTKVVCSRYGETRKKKPLQDILHPNGILKERKPRDCRA
jgi:RNase adaptor protein for sRNA GlmZ degradation